MFQEQQQQQRCPSSVKSGACMLLQHIYLLLHDAAWASVNVPLFVPNQW